MKRSLLAFLVCVGVVCSCVAPALAQTQTGIINGTVRDPNGEALPGVTVNLSGASVMGTKMAVTGASGVFRFPALLPGADYVLEFSLEGFQGMRFENIVVQVGQTATLQVVLELAAVSGEITVTDQSPIVDVTSPTSSTNMSADVLDNIPVVDRSWEDNVNQAAGVVDGSAGIEYFKIYSMRGGSVHANQSAFDGVANTDPTYNAMASGIVYESVEEVQVVNGAMPAELGNISGGFINVVTKSGGNQFRGELGIYHKSEDLQSENVSSEQEAAGASSQKLTDYDDWSFNLGGPIVRDKLWFNAAYGTRNTSKTVPQYSDVDTVENDMYFAKLTWQPLVRHSVVGMYNFHKLGLPTLNAAPFVTPETTYDAFLDYEIAKLKWTAILSDDVFLEVDWGRRTTEGPFGPQPDSGPQYYDLATQITSGGAALYIDNKNGRDQAVAALSVFKDDWAGSHQFKFGLEYETAFYDLYDYNNVSPVMQHNLAGGVPLYVLMFNGTPGLLTQVEREAFNAYAQDTWSVSDRVTLSLGVRVNTWTGGWPHQSQPGFDYGPFVSFPAREFGLPRIKWLIRSPK